MWHAPKLLWGAMSLVKVIFGKPDKEANRRLKLCSIASQRDMTHNLHYKECEHCFSCCSIGNSLVVKKIVGKNVLCL